MDLKIVVNIKRDIIHGENHENEVTECASRDGIIMTEKTKNSTLWVTHT